MYKLSTPLLERRTLPEPRESEREGDNLWCNTLQRHITRQDQDQSCPVVSRCHCECAIIINKTLHSIPALLLLLLFRLRLSTSSSYQGLRLNQNLIISRRYSIIAKFFMGKVAPMDLANSAGLTPKQCTCTTACTSLYTNADELLVYFLR